MGGSGQLPKGSCIARGASVVGLLIGGCVIAWLLWLAVTP